MLRNARGETEVPKSALHMSLTSSMNARLSRAELGISLGASPFRRKDASSGTFARHCRIEFMKQVLPRFESPTQPRGREGSWETAI